MFGLDSVDFQRIAVSSAGALLLSLACVASAAGPARAGEHVAATATAGQVAAGAPR